MVDGSELRVQCLAATRWHRWWAFRFGDFALEVSLWGSRSGGGDLGFRVSGLEV